MPQYMHHVPGRLRLRIARLKGNGHSAQVARDVAASVPGVYDATANPLTGSLIVRYDHRRIALEDLWAALHAQGIVGKHLPADHGAAPAWSAAADQLAEKLMSQLLGKLVERSALALVGALI